MLAGCLLVVAVGLGVLGIGELAKPAVPAAEQTPLAAREKAVGGQPETETVQLARPAAPFAYGLVAAGVELHQQFHEYVQGRVVAMDVSARLPQLFENWEATDDFGATEASPDGLLTQWEEGWYVTHEWSWYGRQILELVPGDVVVINGQAFKVEGLFDYPKESFSDEIHELLGYDYVILQTCEPASELNRIVWGPKVELRAQE